jgi:hypothetical protein
MFTYELVYVGVNNEGSHVRTRSPPPLANGLLETPHSTPKTDKEAIINLYLPGWMPRTVEQTVT